MRDKILLIGALAAFAALVILRPKKGVGAMSDPVITLANIRRGIDNGWYTAVLTRVNGQPAVRLSGKKTDGMFYSYVYPITEADYQALKSDGVQEV